MCSVTSAVLPMLAAKCLRRALREQAMSRVGKPRALPQGVDVKVNGSAVTIKGSKGEQVIDLVDDIFVAIEDNRSSSAAKTRSSFAPCTAPLAPTSLTPSRASAKVSARSWKSSALATVRSSRARSWCSTSASATPSKSTPRFFEFKVHDANHVEVARCRQAGRQPDRRQHSRRAQARALQGQGHPLRG